MASMYSQAPRSTSARSFEDPVYPQEAYDYQQQPYPVNNYNYQGVNTSTSNNPANNTNNNNNNNTPTPTTTTTTNPALAAYPRRPSASNKPVAASPPATAPATQSPASRFYDPNSFAPSQPPPPPPQTAHPYAGGFQYYDYQHQGWSSHYPQGAFPTPQSRPPAATGPEPYYDRNQFPNRNSLSQGQQWYPPHMPPQGVPHHMVPPGQYPWQQSWNQPYYPAPPSAPLPKKDYVGLGKRQPDEPESKSDKKKKKKDEEEDKPVPKPPAKSHLHPPRQAQSAWQLFFNDELNKAKAVAASGNSPGGTPHHAKLNVAQIAKDAGIAYANMDAEQKAYYAQKVQESKDQYAKELAAWQATLTPDDIRAENAFRAQQRKEGKSRKGNIKDPNAPKKPLSAYFLFLKGIREDDALRARVWGDETETTKQSVLAAERWRNLTDDEKKPFLSQAEKDKQEYEAARKIYEDDAAARARGETVPVRPAFPEPAVDVPKPVIRDAAPQAPAPAPAPPPPAAAAAAAAAVAATAAGEQSPLLATSPKKEDPIFNTLTEEFPAFTPLGDIDLTSFQDVAGRSNGEGDWGLLMDDKKAEEKTETKDSDV